MNEKVLFYDEIYMILTIFAICFISFITGIVGLTDVFSVVYDVKLIVRVYEAYYVSCNNR